jgi:hypothetical protein
MKLLRDQGRRLDEQFAVAGPQHLRVRQVGGRIVVLNGQTAEMLDQTIDQSHWQGAWRPKKRRGKETDDFIHSSASR